MERRISPLGTEGFRRFGFPTAIGLAGLFFLVCAFQTQRIGANLRGDPGPEFLPAAMGLLLMLGGLAVAWSQFRDSHVIASGRHADLLARPFMDWFLSRLDSWLHSPAVYAQDAILDRPRVLRRACRVCENGLHENLRSPVARGPVGELAVLAHRVSSTCPASGLSAPSQWCQFVGPAV